jgi:hypothetical protein
MHRSKAQVLTPSRWGFSKDIRYLLATILSRYLNDMAIVLTLKVRTPVHNPISAYSLCTVLLYKIRAKIIANRMRLDLEEVISKEQSAFMFGRLITYNALVAFECVHTMKRNKEMCVRLSLT